MIKNKYLTLVTSILIVCALLFSIVLLSIPTSYASSVTMEYSSKLFDDTKVSDINIDMEEEDWNNMMESPLEEKYYKCNITINGETIYNVGIRTKGNISLKQVVSSDSERYSFKIKFDEYVSGQNYYGLDKLNLNNIYSDPTYMKDYIGYKLFECMGVVSPEVSFSNITVNGDAWGLYCAVEGLEESYLKRNFGKEYGKLYKAEGIGTDLVYKGQEQINYSGLKDNAVGDVTDEEFQKVVDMIYNLNQGNLEGYLNIEDTLKYFAVNSAIVNLDSYQSNLFHNYYIYEKNGECTVLPWDLNLAFGGFVGGGPINRDGEKNNDLGDKNFQTLDRNDNFPGDVAPPQMEKTSDFGVEQENMFDKMPGEEMFGSNSSSIINYPIDEPTSASMESSPLLSQLLGNEEYLDMYHKYLSEFVEKCIYSGYFEKVVNYTANLLDEYVKKDNNAFYTYDEFKVAVEELNKFALYRAESISKQISGEIPSTKDGQEEVDLSTYFGEGAVDIKALGGMSFGMVGNNKEGEEKFNPMMDMGNKENNKDINNSNNKPNTNNMPPVNMGGGFGENDKMKPSGNPIGGPMDFNQVKFNESISKESIIIVSLSMLSIIISILIVIKSKRRKFIA